MLEAFQAALLERVDAYHLSTTLDRFTQWFKHARVVGAGVLAEHENRVRVLEVFKRHGAFADTNALRQGNAAGLVTHVRAVREIIGAVGAHEQLIHERSFVAGTTRGVELGHVRVRQGVQVLGDQRERGIPGDRLVAVGFGVVSHWLGQTALILQPVVALFAQCADAVTGEERRVNAALGGFPVDRLGAVFAELDHAAFRRVTPRTARAVEAAVLIGLEHRAQVFQRVVAGQPVVGHAEQRAPAACGTLVRLVARDWFGVSFFVHAHA
jgi:hypothetical protein